MVRISRSRMNMEDGRIDRAAFKDYGEIATGSSSTVFTTSAYTVNIENGNTYSLILNDDCSFTFANPTGSGNACSFTLILKQDQVGGWQVAWPTSMRWQSGVTPELTTYPGDFDVLTFFTVNGGSNWIGMQATRDHINGVGELWAWGDNSQGQQGQNNAVATDRSSPAQVGALTSWAVLSAGGTNAAAVKTDGTLWTWGNNASGALGQNIATTTDRSSPAQVGALTNWKAVSVGGVHSLAVKTDGTLWAWGYNTYGQRGSNTSANSSSPAQVGTLTNWLAVAAGGNSSDTNTHSLAIKIDGTLWSWGGGSSGKLGNNATSAVSSPAQVGALTTWWKIAAGEYHSLALKTDGTLWAWGLGTSGQLGQVSSATSRSSPTQIGALTDWAVIAAGGEHSLAVKTDGTLWAWGLGTSGQLGQVSSATSRSSPVQIGALTTWAHLIAGEGHSLALKTDGTLWTWGRNDEGQIGVNTSVNSSSPIQVGSQTNWSHVTAGDKHSIVFRYPPTIAEEPAFSLTFISSAVSTTYGLSHDMGTLNLGTPSASRRIFVAAGGMTFDGNPFTISQITVAGNNTTEVVTQIAEDTSNFFFNRASIRYVDLPAGSTGNVTVTFAGQSAWTCGVAIYTLYSHTSTIVNTTSAAQIASTPLTFDLAFSNLLANDAYITYALQYDNTTLRTWTWEVNAGSASIAEDFDQTIQDIAGERTTHSGASGLITSGTTATIRGTTSGISSSGAIVLVGAALR